jgi:hypothetical protein
MRADLKLRTSSTAAVRLGGVACVAGGAHLHAPRGGRAGGAVGGAVGPSTRNTLWEEDMHDGAFVMDVSEEH